MKIKMLAMRMLYCATVLLSAADIAVAGNPSGRSAYLECVAEAKAQQLSYDSCCFSDHTNYISASIRGGEALANNCEPPFGFCHEHTVGFGWDKLENIYTASGSSNQVIAYYRCGDYRESCNDVCSNQNYWGLKNSDQLRSSDTCFGLEAEDFGATIQRLSLRRWNPSYSLGAP